MEAARGEAIEYLAGETLPDNIAMLRLARKMGLRRRMTPAKE